MIQSTSMTTDALYKLIMAAELLKTSYEQLCRNRV